MNNLKVKMLGKINITFNGEEITNLFSSKSIGLICFLTSNKGMKQNRTKIVNLLWSNSEDSSAKYNLRYNLWSINKIFKNYNVDKFIISENNEIYINSCIEQTTDIELLININENIKNKSFDIDDLLTIRNNHSESFLDGFYIKDCLEFNDWIYNNREEFQKMYSDVLRTLIQYYKGDKKYNNCIKIIKQLLLLNPYNEELYIQLIKQYLNINDKINALLYYNKCVNVFREELNITPTDDLLKWENIIKSANIYKNIPRQKAKLYLLEEYEISKDEKQNFNEILINCCPDRLQYSFLVELSNKLLAQYSKQNIDLINTNLWQDISQINPLLYKNKHMNFLNEDIFKIRLFNSFSEILRILNEVSTLKIVINKFNFIDKISFEFLKYMLFYDKFSGQIYIVNSSECSEIIEIEKYFTLIKP
ncbi:DNA-binding SARP family transcriptional activator [Sedimentibacter acidaminivorans]|uniref:DNA-binding SARP family transcriptional activator n=1 Tax=Sedimentibacter acidaminivorans TaxID=913099 RepID=A0ABS4GCM3_9FIRM|nr:BTAD domain-containing putative transcriptional regulator [Sedimentibacter acidaminivorans]MBP1925447.1 DNA-binding SARP family transcriptional activator [Sedimentibacter acidaminivorans]